MASDLLYPIGSRLEARIHGRRKRGVLIKRVETYTAEGNDVKYTVRFRGDIIKTFKPEKLRKV